MKILVSAIFLVLLAVTENTCRNKKDKNKISANCYKGRLEIKGGCMNYTVAVIEGNIDTSLVQASWTDENTGKNYKKVFALGSKCDFPNTINEGDEFYFQVDSTSVQNCAVCMMYYPVPSKKISIRVVNDPCPKP
jgi:hypothetical protein